jgi:hypothetical protein
MVTLGALWLPIFLSAILVFFVSFLVHMVLKYHASDYTPLPNEDAVRAAIRAGNPPPRQYIIPYCADPKDMAKPEITQKFVEGPVAVINLKAPGAPTMTPMLVQWFVFVLVISICVAYVGCHTVDRGATYMDVFGILGAVGFLAYAAGTVPAAIWMGKPWSVAIKEVFDGLLYGLVTAGTFGWLWPR